MAKGNEAKLNITILDIVTDQSLTIKVSGKMSDWKGWDTDNQDMKF